MLKLEVGVPCKANPKLYMQIHRPTPGYSVANTFCSNTIAIGSSVLTT